MIDKQAQPTSRASSTSPVVGGAPGKRSRTAGLAPVLGGALEPDRHAPALRTPAPGPPPLRPPEDPFALHLAARPAPRAEPPAGAAAPAAAASPAAGGETASATAAAEAAAAEAALRAAIRVDARFVAALLEAVDVDGELKIDRASAGLVLSRFAAWSALGRLGELVAAVRQERIGGVLAALLEATTAWTYLVAVLRDAERVRLYDLLADGNLDARNAGRFTEDVLDFWDVQMRQDAGTVKAAYRALASADGGPAAAATQRVRVLVTIGKYRDLDARYRMQGTLLSRFLLRLDVTVTLPGGLFGIGEQQTRLLDDLKRHMGGNLGALMELLQASNLELARQDAPALLTLGDSLAEDAVAALASVDQVVAFLAEASGEVARDCIRFLARTPSKLPLLIELVAEHFLDLTELCAFGLSLLSARAILQILERVDPARLWELYLALVTCTAGVVFLPQLFAAYWLLPDETRDRVFGSIGRAAFLPILREARAFLVPVVRDLIDRRLPVGQGCYFERGLSASVGVATAGGDSSFSVIRTGPDRFQYDERFTIHGGVEVGGGRGRTEGKRADDGTSQRFWGHEVAGNLGAMAHFTSQNRYEFPIFDDDAFVGFLAAFCDVEAAVSLGAFLFEELDQIDPLPYLTRAKLEPKLSGEGRGVAATGMREGEGGADGAPAWGSGDKPGAMGGSVGGMFGAQASATIGLLLEAGGALEVEKKGDGHEVSVQLGVRAAGTLALRLPGLGVLSQAVPPGTDAGTAVKLTCVIVGLSDQAPALQGGWRLSLVGTTGDLDTHAGAASETEVTIATDGAVDSVEDFIGALGQATFKRRLGIASGLGRKLLSAIANQKNLTAQLKARYREAGVKLAGSLDLEFELAAADTRRVARIFHGLVAAAATAEDPARGLREAVVGFFTTGELPECLAAAGRELAEILAASLTKVRYHVEIGGAVAAGRKVDGGAVGGHGYLGAGWIWADVVTDDVKALDADEVLAVVTRRVSDAADTVLDVLALG